MRVLFCGNYRENSGWGNAGKGYILALDSVGIDVVPRPLHFKQSSEYPNKIKELEQKSDKDCDIIIQHTLPHLFSYSSKFSQNIGLYVSETSHFRNTNWTQHINMMDKGWVASTDSVTHSHNSYVTIPLSVVPHAFDIGKYNKRYEKLDIPDLKNKFVFYFIGEFSRRKNLAALLKAYHLEFHPSEPVAIIIKSHIPGMSSQESQSQMVNYCQDIKRQLNLYQNLDNYLNEIIITQYLSDEQIMQIHTTGDCYVGPSFGEGWNIEAFDAMAMGRTPICSNVGGPKDYIKVPREISNGLGEKTCLEEESGWLVSTTEEPVFGMTQWTQTPNLYLGNENWWNIDVLSLQKVMREAFENKEEKNKRAALGRVRAQDFSYEKVGQLMKSYLENENIDSKETLLYEKSK